jgi:hypothetical protein
MEPIQMQDSKRSLVFSKLPSRFLGENRYLTTGKKNIVVTPQW